MTHSAEQSIKLQYSAVQHSTSQYIVIECNAVTNDAEVMQADLCSICQGSGVKVREYTDSLTTIKYVKLSQTLP